MKKILLSCVTCLLALGLVTACEDEVEEVTPEDPNAGVVEPSGDDGGDSGTGTGEVEKEEEEGAGTTLQYVEVSELVSGESYYFGYPNGDDYYFFNGNLYYTSALYCTDNVEEALMVTVTGDDKDGWTLTYTGTDSEEYTIYCYMYDENSVDITAVKTSELEGALEDNETDKKTYATATFTWDSEHAGLSVMLGETACYVSTYAQYKEISLSKGNFNYAASHFYKAVEVPNPTAVTVSAEETSVKVGSTLQLTATVEPEGAYADVVWSSSDSTIATVSDTGLVKGISEAEEVTITATSVGNPSAAGSITIAVTEKSTVIPEGLICSYDFSLASDVTNSEMDTDRVKTLFDESFVAGESSSSIVTGVTSATKAYPTAGGSTGGDNPNTNLQLSNDCLKLGSSGNAGSVTLSLSAEVCKVVAYATCWASSGNNAASTLTINEVPISLSQCANEVADASLLVGDTFEFTSSSTLSLSSNNRLMIFSLELYSDVSVE